MMMTTVLDDEGTIKLISRKLCSNPNPSAGRRRPFHHGPGRTLVFYPISYTLLLLLLLLFFHLILHIFFLPPPPTHFLPLLLFFPTSYSFSSSPSFFHLLPLIFFLPPSPSSFLWAYHCILKEYPSYSSSFSTNFLSYLHYPCTQHPT